MSNTEKMLEIKDLSVIYETDLETVYAVNGVTLSLEKGATLGLVGETGAGKTTLALTLMRLLPERTGKVTSGSITFEGENVVELPEANMRKIRGDKIAMIFQDPIESLNPKMTIEEIVGEGLKIRGQKDRAEVHRQVVEMLEKVGLVEEHATRYPHEFSGGQRQAVTLLMATMNSPKLLLLDEHTAALDPGTAEKVLELTKSIVAKDNITCMMITHNMQSALDLGNRTLMMDKGNIIMDVSGAERDGMTVQDFLDRFKAGSGKALDNDRMLLS